MTISSLRLGLLLLGCVGAVPACATSTQLVTLDAGPDAESPSEGGPLPDAGALPDAEAGASGGGARVFVTATSYAAKSLGGGASRVAGADGFCANAAAAAGLGGNWVAWLSTSTVNAIDRVTGTGPWYLVDVQRCCSRTRPPSRRCRAQG